MIEQIELQSKIFWEKTWNKFNKFNAIIAPSSKLVQHLVANVERNGVILDLGCGEGRNSVYLSRIGFNVIAIDLSLEAAIATKANFFEETLRGSSIGGDARQLPFKSNCIDGVLAHHIFDYLTKTGFKLGISEVFRVLKPGGVLLMTMDTFVTARADNHTVIKDDGSVVYISGANKGLLIRPYVEQELYTVSMSGCEILKDDLTPKRNKILMLKKASIV